MNVTDQWMLERMQQMAANMAASLPQTSQNADVSKPEKGDSFKEMMDKAKDQKVEAPKKTETPKKTEDVQKTDPRKVTETKNPDGTTARTVKLTAMEAAAVAAGYAALSPVQPDGTVWLAVSVGQGAENNPLVQEILMNHAGVPMEYAFQATMVEGEDQWTIEATSDLVTALEQFLKAANDPRSAEAVLGELKHSQNGPLIQPKIEIFADKADTGDQDDANLDASAMAGKPLFHDVKAAPIKVGENFQLDTQEPDMDDHLADAVRFAAQQGLRQIEIKLSPENLGNLTVKLTQASDGTLQVVLHAANDKAANLLNQHLDNLNAALQGYHQNSEVRVEVQRNDNGQQAEQQQHQQTNPDGHNQQQQQQERRQEEQHSGDFVQKLRLGLFGLDDMT